MDIQRKTARLTVLLDPSRKLAFERACRENDMTPSQVLRHLIREYLAGQEADAVPLVRPIAVRPARRGSSPVVTSRAAATRRVPAKR